MNITKWISRSIRDKGFTQTTKILANLGADLLFDWRYGTDTMRWIARDDLAVSSDNLEYSQPYKATKCRPLIALLRQLALPKDCNFVDIGAGKGRVVLIGAEYGFKKSVGIEFSAPLCSIARRNIEIFAAKRKSISAMEIAEADATKYEFQHDDRVFFMFNPFHSPVMENVVQNLRRSLLRHPRSAWLIYNDPLYHHVIADAGIFSASSRILIGGTEFRVYATKGSNFEGEK